MVEKAKLGRFVVYWQVFHTFLSRLVMAEVTIRPATPGDHVAICALVIQNHLALSQDFPEEYIRQVIDVPNDFGHLVKPLQFQKSRFLVATEQDSMVGCAGIIPSNVKADPHAPPDHVEVELTAVTVAPQFRKRGIARRLIQQLIQDVLSDYACRCVRLVTLKERMAPACRLYESFGFLVEREERAFDKPVMTVCCYTLNFPDK